MPPEMKSHGADDPHNLKRFEDAQNPVYSGVLTELRDGNKRGHWMWFFFPQLAGLGYSSTAKYFGIASLAEAKAYFEHPILGPRLIECTRLVNQVSGRNVHDIFAYPDDLKFRSSMTLFAKATGNEVFKLAIQKYCQGEYDPLTEQLLDA